MNLKMKSILLLILIIILPTLISSELYTALVHLEKLLNTEKQIVGSLEKYLLYEEERISQLRQLAQHYSKLHNVASQDVDSYLANPINAYLLVKRLTTDWKLVEDLIHHDKSELIDMLHKNETFPSAEDLSGIISILFFYG